MNTSICTLHSIGAALTAALLSATVAAQTVPAAPVPPPSQRPLSSAEGAAPGKGSVNQLNWLSGCWQANSARDGSTISESWFAPRGGTIMGVGLTFRDDKTITSEAMRMYDEGDSVKLWMRPAGRAEVTMTLDTIGDPFVAFSVKEADVVTKLRYEKKNATEMVATLRFETGENRRGADFGFTRVDCAASFLPAVKPAGKEASNEVLVPPSKDAGKK